MVNYTLELYIFHILYSFQARHIYVDIWPAGKKTRNRVIALKPVESKVTKRVCRASGVSFGNTTSALFVPVSASFLPRTEETDVAFSPSGHRGKRSAGSSINERTNRWIKVGPQAVIGTLETLEFRSPFRAYPSTVPLSLTFKLSLFLSNYYVRERSSDEPITDSRVTNRVIDGFINYAFIN